MKSLLEDGSITDKLAFVGTAFGLLKDIPCVGFGLSVIGGEVSLAARAKANEAECRELARRFLSLEGPLEALQKREDKAGASRMCERLEGVARKVRKALDSLPSQAPNSLIDKATHTIKGFFFKAIKGADEFLKIQQELTMLVQDATFSLTADVLETQKTLASQAIAVAQTAQKERIDQLQSKLVAMEAVISKQNAENAQHIQNGVAELLEKGVGQPVPIKESALLKVPPTRADPPNEVH